MKFVSLVVALCFSLNVLAASGSVEALQKSVDEYQYALSVEWDQKDGKFFDLKTQEFMGDLQKLIKEDGLSQKEILTMLETQIRDKNTLEAIKLRAALMGKAQSSEEIAKMVKEASREMYAQGASWNGSMVIPVIAAVALVAVIAYSVWWDANHVCVRYETQYVCNTYNCGTGGGFYGSYPGYYGGCTGIGDGFGYTTCGYADVCVDYEKKD